MLVCHGRTEALARGQGDIHVQMIASAHKAVSVVAHVPHPDPIADIAELVLVAGIGVQKYGLDERLAVLDDVADGQPEDLLPQGLLGRGGNVHPIELVNVIHTVIAVLDHGHGLSHIVVQSDQHGAPAGENGGQRLSVHLDQDVVQRVEDGKFGQAPADGVPLQLGVRQHECGHTVRTGIANLLQAFDHVRRLTQADLAPRLRPLHYEHARIELVGDDLARRTVGLGASSHLSDPG